MRRPATVANRRPARFQKRVFQRRQRDKAKVVAARKRLRAALRPTYRSSPRRWVLNAYSPNPTFTRDANGSLVDVYPRKGSIQFHRFVNPDGTRGVRRTWTPPPQRMRRIRQDLEL